MSDMSAAVSEPRDELGGGKQHINDCQVHRVRKRSSYFKSG